MKFYMRLLSRVPLSIDPLYERYNIASRNTVAGKFATSACFRYIFLSTLDTFYARASLADIKFHQRDAADNGTRSNGGWSSWNVCGHVIVLSIAMIGHLEQLINLFRFAVSVPSHRRIHSAWRFFKGDRTESTTRTIADLAHGCVVVSISRAKIGSGFSHCIFLGSLGSTPVPSRDAKGFSSQRKRKRIEWEKDTPHYRCACGK